MLHSSKLLLTFSLTQELVNVVGRVHRTLVQRRENSTSQGANQCITQARAKDALTCRGLNASLLQGNVLCVLTKGTLCAFKWCFANNALTQRTAKGWLGQSLLRQCTNTSLNGFLGHLAGWGCTAHSLHGYVFRTQHSIQRAKQCCSANLYGLVGRILLSFFSKTASLFLAFTLFHVMSFYGVISTAFKLANALRCADSQTGDETHTRSNTSRGAGRQGSQTSNDGRDRRAKGLDCSLERSFSDAAKICLGLFHQAAALVCA